MSKEPVGAEDIRSALREVGDDPITSAAQDRLGRLPFAKRSAQLIGEVAGHTPSIVAGLIGPWGAGKTSVLAMIEEELSSDEHWTVVWFNPWELNDLASLVREFLTTLRVAIGDDRRARKAISKYATKVAPYANAVPVVGKAGSAVLTAAGEDVLGDTSLAAQRAKLESALRATDAKILVLIDDVDRLQEDELSTLLKLVRLVGRLPGISYVLAYDETTILDVLGRSDVAVDSPSRALAYLDKIVQLRLDLPPVAAARVEMMVEQKINDLASAHSITLDQRDMNRLGRLYEDDLRPSLTEPRNIKRFFGQVEALYDLVADEVDFVDFFLITFLRVFYPSVHREVLRRKAELTGSKFEIRRPSGEDRAGRWAARLAELKLDGHAAERALHVVGALFPRLGAYAAGEAATRSIASAEYFDRYMYLAVPPGDFPDSKVVAAVNEVLDGQRAEAAEELLAAIDTAATPIIEKLRRIELPDHASAHTLLPFAAELVAAVPIDTGFLGFGQQRALYWITRLLEQATIDEPHGLLSDLRQHLTTNQIAVAVLRAGDQDHGEVNIPTHLAPLAAAVATVLNAELESAAKTPPSAINTTLTWTATQAEQLGVDPDTIRTRFRQAIESGTWPPHDIVAVFVPTAIAVGSRIHRLMDPDLPGLDHFIGIDWLLEHLDPETVRSLADARPDSGDTSFEARRATANHALAREIEQRAAADVD